MYWKVLMHSTNAGYRSEPRRNPVPLATRPAAAPDVAAAPAPTEAR
jgi:hypothetical protein